LFSPLIFHRVCRGKIRKQLCTWPGTWRQTLVTWRIVPGEGIHFWHFLFCQIVIPSVDRGWTRRSTQEMLFNQPQKEEDRENERLIRTISWLTFFLSKGKKVRGRDVCLDRLSTIDVPSPMSGFTARLMATDLSTGAQLVFSFSCACEVCGKMSALAPGCNRARGKTSSESTTIRETKFNRGSGWIRLA